MFCLLNSEFIFCSVRRRKHNNTPKDIFFAVLSGAKVIIKKINISCFFQHLICIITYFILCMWRVEMVIFLYAALSLKTLPIIELSKSPPKKLVGLWFSYDFKLLVCEISIRSLRSFDKFIIQI